MPAGMPPLGAPPSRPLGLEPRVRKCLLSWLQELWLPRSGCLPCTTSGSQPEASRGCLELGGAPGWWRSWELPPGQRALSLLPHAGGSPRLPAGAQGL